MDMENKRLAVLVGCNYAGTRYELRGCINDVYAMREVLVSRFGFHHDNIKVLTDEPGSPVMPTGTNIKQAVGRMINRAEPGDVLYFHYSGHGTQIPSVRPGHPFSKDEAIVPCDFNLITDVDFRELVNRVPNGASFTMLSDSCHSGGLIDKEKEQIGPSSFAAGVELHSHTPRLFQHHTHRTTHYHTPKTIPFESILEEIALSTGINTHDVGTHMLELFGMEASLRYRLPHHELDSFQLHPDNGILLSGCQANETSADVNPDQGGGEPHGAFTNAVQTVLKSSGNLSNRQVVMQARNILQTQGIAQHPCLYSSDENANAAFLRQPGGSSY